MTTRSVRYILSRSLRLVGQETDFSEAPTEAYVDAYDFLIDMLDSWKTDGILVINNQPQSIDDTLSSADPIPAIYNNLACQMTDHFHFDLPASVRKKAAKGKRTLRNRTRGIARIGRPCGMPRGSGNYYYWLYYNTCDSDQLVTQSGVPIVTSGNQS